MENEIQSILADQYGIEVYRENLSEENLQQRGYRKATPEEVAHFNAFFQYAPQIVKDSYYASSVQEAFSSAVQGTYRLKLDPKYHLGASSKTSGAFNGNAFDAKNNLKSQAEWLVNDAKFDISMIPELATIAFQAASFVTGQYFMAQINRNLTTIRKDIGDIKAFLERRRIAEIEHAYEELEDIKKHLEYGILDLGQKSLYLNRLRRIQEIANINCCNSRLAIEHEKNNATDKDKDEIIKQRIQTIFSFLQDYRFCLWLFSQAKLVEIYLRDYKMIEDLEIERNTMDEINSKFYDTIRDSEYWMRSYFREHVPMDTLSHFVFVALGAAGAIGALSGVGLPIVLAAGTSIGASIGFGAGMISESQLDKKRQEHNELISNQVNSVYEYRKSIEAPVRSLSQYIETNRKYFEAIKAGDAIYTNLPAQENVDAL